MISSRMDEFSRFDDLDNNHSNKFAVYFMITGLVLYILHEQIHWSLLMTGFFLADEPPEMPYPARHYVATSEMATKIAEQVLKFFDSVTDENNDKWSPQVVETLYWWFERWGYAYLFAPDVNGVTPVIVPGGGDWQGIARWAVTRMRKDVEGWVGEKEVISQVCLLRTLRINGRSYERSRLSRALDEYGMDC